MTDPEPELTQFQRYHRTLTRPVSAWRNVPPLAREAAAILTAVVLASAITGGLIGALLRH